MLQGKISDLESESKRREREISEHHALSDKINQLQKSLEEAKSQVWLVAGRSSDITCSYTQRRLLMESAKEELQRNREREEQRTKEISKLKLESSKREADSKKWKDEASAKSVRPVVLMNSQAIIPVTNSFN